MTSHTLMGESAIKGVPSYYSMSLTMEVSNENFLAKGKCVA